MKFTQKGKKYTWICENKLCNRPLDADCTVVSTTEHVRRFCSMECVVESFNNHRDELIAEGINFLPVPLIGEKIAERIKVNNPEISERVGENIVEYFKEEQHKITPNLDCINVRGIPYESIISSFPVREWKVFEKPRAGYDYSIGVFTGDGLGGDPSCISVMRIGKEKEPDEQVAELVSTNHNPSQLVPIIAQIARMYGEKCIDPRGPMIVIEQISAPGDTVQAQLKIMGLTRFYKAVNSKGIKRDGWYSNSWSAPIMMDRFKEAVKEGWYKPKSVKLTRYDSMRVPNKELRSNPYFMAAAQSYVGYHSFDEDKRNA